MSTMMSPDDAARPENPTPLPESDIYAAVREFVLAYALPALDPTNVIQGWRNRGQLPAGATEYAVISVTSASQHGTTVEKFSAPDPDPALPGIVSIAALMKVAVMVDFHSDGDAARLRAQRLAVVARSSIGVQFFNDRGMSSLYADEVREHCFKDDAQQVVRLCTTALHLSLWSGDSVEFPYFDKASLARLIDVDAHHKP